jgi:4-amino-4-deoxy-L-arabinose transferase-like glycosyltransferase
MDRRLVTAAVLMLSAIFLFAGNHAIPIVLWDESRNVVNALEMKQTGLSLVTTYGGYPDLWNTKPPLLIWLMTGSTLLFGSSEWALRLPSMLAAMGTLWLVMYFVRRTTGSIGTGALAAIFLVLSPAMFGEHSARTADYDALLLFFVTAYLSLLFFCLHRMRPALSTLALAAGAILCATLTKSVAGLIPGLGVGVYLVLLGRVPRLWRSPRYAVAAIGIAVSIILFLGVREAQTPGYLVAAWHNDAAGRFTDLLIGEKRSQSFYVRQLLAGYFSVTPLLLLSPLILSHVRGRSRLVLAYSLCIICTQLVVISTATTKLNHYILPAMPFMAIAAAITLRAIVAYLLARPRLDTVRGKLLFVTSIVAVTLSLAGAEGAVVRRYHDPLQNEAAEHQGASYGAILAALSRIKGAHVTVIDPGFRLEETPHYMPVLRAYRLIWAERGLPTRYETDAGRIAALHDSIVASCAAPIVPDLLRRGADIAGVSGCAAIRMP